MKQILLILAIVSILVLAGCAKPVQKEDTTTAEDQDAVTESIDDADEVSEGLEDPEAEQELDDIGNVLSDW